MEDYHAQALREAYHLASSRTQGANDLLTLLFDQLPAAELAKALALRDRLQQACDAAQVAYQTYRFTPPAGPYEVLFIAEAPKTAA